MTFKQYLKTPEARRKIKKIIKKRHALPVCTKSRHMDTSNMGSTAALPGASPTQPSLS